MKHLAAAILILLMLDVQVAGVIGQRSWYRAGVFQHVDPSNQERTLNDIMLESVSTYQEQAHRAALLGVYILVFPEYGVTGVSVPTTRSEIRPYLQVLPSIEPGPEPWNPCLESDAESFNSTILKSLSCTARTNDLILVVNLPTLVRCSPVDDDACPSDGAYQFNTDVALDANGTVLATYHKINLYHEPAFDRPPYPSDHVTSFVTDVATFGLITCFDLLWHDPTVTLVRERGVRDIVMPTAWVDGLPFLTSVQSQMAWAIGLDINLLAANIQKSQDGYRGSGIYSGRRGFLDYVYGPSNTSRLIVADVPLSSNVTTPRRDVRDPLFNYSGIIYDDLSNYTFVALNASQESNRAGHAALTNGNLTCAVEYEFEKAVDDGDYFLAGYDGSITLGDGDYRLAIQTCALMWCEDGDTARCAHPPVTSEAHLVALKLEGHFDTTYIYPSILRHDLLLIDTSEWRFEKGPDERGRCRRPWDLDSPSMDPPVTWAQLVTQQNFSHRPLVASLYGRMYDLDG